MANENLKDEMLSEDQLDQVAGGTYLESADDAKRFKDLGVNIYKHDVVGVPVLMHDEFVKLRATFEKYGVSIKDHGGLINENQYFINGKQVSRDDAWKHINAQFGK